MTRRTLTSTLRAASRNLDSGCLSSRALVEACLARATDPAGEGCRTFVKLWVREAIAAADLHDRQRKRGEEAPLAGIPISIKDLFDVAGETTRAGSRVRADAEPAVRDAAVVAKLRAAGAILIGRTNMSEFAFSGVGHNPHYGTPGNPWDRARVPGGSSSGAAVSVADGMALAALGSDTGGSVRIPAALCGLSGFKPTKARVDLDGIIPLSTTLDSIGSIGQSIDDCAVLDAVLTGRNSAELEPVGPKDLRFGIPQTLVLDDLDRHTSIAFQRTLSALSRCGAKLHEFKMPLLLDIVRANANGGFPPVEALAWHEHALRTRGDEYDPHARMRFEQGHRQSGADYVRLCWRRAEVIRRASEVLSTYDALIMPTCPIVAPRIEEIQGSEDKFWSYNNLLPRNTALVNFLDCCAATLPIQPLGEAPVGLMVVGGSFKDLRLLAISGGIERSLPRIAE